MRYHLPLLLTLLVLPAGLRADEQLEALKKKALENWNKVQGGPHSTAETEHFLLLAPKGMEEKLKEAGALLEKHYDLSSKALFGAAAVPVKGRIVAYMLDKPEQLDSFLRRVEKRRPLRQENGSFNASDEGQHVVAVQRESTDPPLEVQAAQQVAALLMQRKAGPSTIIPYWLQNGFGRATYYRADPKGKAVTRERQEAFRIMQTKKTRSAQEVWNGSVEGEEAAILEAHLADFLAYGPARMKFPALVEAFRPGENEERKSMDQALQSADLKADVVIKSFRQWVLFNK